MSKGWFLIDRKFFNNFLWTESRDYSKAEAWLDLIYQARYKNESTKKMINGQLVEWHRGQLIASIRFLRKRWNWRSNSKVEGFLSMLEKEDMIRRDTKTPIGRITICNYEKYQKPEDTRQDTNKTSIGQVKDKTEKKGVNKVIKYHADSDFPWDGKQSIDYSSFVSRFNELYNRSLQVTNEKREQIRARLRDFTGVQVVQAWRNRLDDEWLSSPDGEKYLGNWAAATRSSEKIDKYLNKAPETGLLDNSKYREVQNV